MIPFHGFIFKIEMSYVCKEFGTDESGWLVNGSSNGLHCGPLNRRLGWRVDVEGADGEIWDFKWLSLQILGPRGWPWRLECLLLARGFSLQVRPWLWLLPRRGL